MHNNTEREQLNFVSTVLFLFCLSLAIGLIDLGERDAFPIYGYIRELTIKFVQGIKYNLSDVLIMLISIFVYWGLAYFLLMCLRSLLGIFLKSKIVINFQIKILKTKVGSYMHERRLGYIMNLAFWGDILQFFILVALYIKCLITYMASGHFDSKLYIVYCIKLLSYYAPAVLLVLIFVSMLNPLTAQNTKYLKTQKNALILHESGLPRSSSSIAPNMQICSQWFVLDEYEYKFLIKRNSFVELSLIIVHVEQNCNMNGIKNMQVKYEEYYMKPHIISIFIVEETVEQYWNTVNLDKSHIDYYYTYNHHRENFNPSKDVIRRINDISVSTNSKEVMTLLKTLPHKIVDYYNILHTAPPCIFVFYKRIINFFSLRQAVNGFFDIIDLALRLRVIACSNLDDSNSNRLISSMGIYSRMIEILLEYNCVNFNDAFNTNFLDQEMRKLLGEKLRTNINDKIDFVSLLRMISNLRNVTKAHGFIKDNELRKMFQLMFCLSLYVFSELEICSASIFFDPNGNRPVFKFKSKLIESFGNYALFDSERNMFIATDKGKFINMLTGEIRSRTEKK